METFPQIQTIIDEYSPPISTVIDAPWVSVTSVNGMTGDVLVEIKLGDFEPNHFYQKNTAIIYNGSLYYAKEDFTSSEYFRLSDWNYPSFTQEQADWTESNTSSNAYIKNKPTKLSQFTNDLNLISEDDVNSIVTTRIEPLEESVEGLDARITTNTGSISTLGTQVSGLNSSLSTLSTNVEAMKSDGSVVKLGTNTVGGVASPIYWSSGVPALCNTNKYDGVVTTDASGYTVAGNRVIFNRYSAGGGTTPYISASGNSLVTYSSLYRGSATSQNEYITRGDNLWTFIAGQTLTSTTWATYPIVVPIPYSYQGYGWEYKVVIGAECAYTTALMCLAYGTGSSGDAGSFQVQQNVKLSFMKTMSGSMNNFSSSDFDNRACGFEWYMNSLNDSCVAEVMVGRAGSGNHWNFASFAGGISGGWGSAFCGAGRANTANPITGFAIYSGSSVMDFLSGSHVEIYGRYYG